MDEVRVRPAGAEDFGFLATMLGEAAVWRPEKPTPTGEEAMTDPRLSVYLDGWPRPGDVGLIAEREEPLGAAWYRPYTEDSHGYGFVEPDVPALSIAVVATHRRQGIGRLLLTRLIELSEAEGVDVLSLSVNTENPARHLYASVGFRVVETRATAITMVRNGRSV